MTTVRDTFDKLLAAGAIQTGENKEPSFTLLFMNYIKVYSALERETLHYIQEWRKMLTGFHLSLVNLTDEELSAIVTLLEYQHRAKKEAFPVNV